MGGRLDAQQIPRPGTDGGSSDGYLRGKRLTDYFEGTEQPAFVLSNESKGIEHEQGSETTVVEPGSDYRAVAAITNERVLLAVGGNDEQTGLNRDASLPYTEIRSVETETGLFKSRLTITARTGNTYHFPLGGRTDLADVEGFVERAISHWVSLDRHLETARDHLSTIESSIETGDPEAATDAYRRTRESLDRAEEVAAAFEPGTDAMARRIDQLDTQLTLTEIGGHRIRGQQLVDRAEHARSENDYRRALAAYTTAKDQYERAADLAEDTEYHGVEEIRSELVAVSTAVSEVRTEPYLRAANACVEALQAEAPAPERWANATTVCHETYALLRRDERFDGDPEALRFQIEWLVQNRMNAHERAAEQAVTRGDDHRESGDAAAAREAYETARDHVEQARDLAGEYRSGDPERYEDVLETLHKPC